MPPSDNPSTPAAAKAIDFTDTLAKAKAIAAKIGNSAAAAAAAAAAAPNAAPASPPAVANMPTAPVASPAAVSAAPTSYGKRPYEDDPYQQGGDPYTKRPAYDGYASHYGYGSQISHHAPPVRNEHSVQEDMPVPGHLVGLIIGRGGENLKRIERETGCRIQFTQDGGAPGDRERFVNIIGTPAGIADAKRQIQDIVASSMNNERGPPGGGGYGGMGRGGGGGGGYGMGAYGNAVGNQSSMQIPGSKVGLVIGRGGETIRDLQDRSGARIAVAPPSAQDHGTNMRTITLTGEESAIERAKQFIEEIVNDMAPRGTYGGGSGYQSTPTATMQVPQEAIGLVIGRGGETVKQLQIMTRAKIQVQQVEPGSYPAERTINLYGPPEAVEYARQMIMEKVAGARESDRFGQGQNHGGYGGYGGYQYGQQASGYDPTYAGYAATAATSGAPASTAGYTPEQQAAYAQYYAYQYGNAYSYAPVAGAASAGETATNATESASGDGSSSTPATSTAADASDVKATETTTATGADSSSASTSAAGTPAAVATAGAGDVTAVNPLSAYGYAYANYYAHPAAANPASVAPATASESTTASAAEGSASTEEASTSESKDETKDETKEPSTSTDAATATPASTTTAAVNAADPNAAAAAYAAYYAQHGYSADAYQQYYAQYYGYQPQAAAAAAVPADSATSDATATAQSVDGREVGGEDGAVENKDDNATVDAATTLSDNVPPADETNTAVDSDASASTEQAPTATTTEDEPTTADTEVASQ